MYARFIVFICLRHHKFTMSQTVALPENDFRAYLAIWQNASLEARNKTTIRHHADRQLKRRDRLLRDREHDLVVSSGWSFNNKKVLLDVSSETLSASIDQIVNYERKTVFSPRDKCFGNRLVTRFALLFVVKSHISIINICLEINFKVW